MAILWKENKKKIVFGHKWNCKRNCSHELLSTDCRKLKEAQDPNIVTQFEVIITWIVKKLSE